MILSVSRIMDVNHILNECEERYIKNAVVKRRREFIMGRYLISKCCEGLGVTGGIQVKISKFREPIWPEGYYGSISHSNKYCVAVLGKGDGHVGVDIEEIKYVSEEYKNIICTGYEIDCLDLCDNKQKRLTEIFCAKEAFYKMQFPITKISLNFHDVEIEINKNTFRLKSTRKARIKNETELCGNYLSINDEALLAIISN